MLWLRSALFAIMFWLGVLTFGLLITIMWPITPLTFRRKMATYWARYNSLMLRLCCNLRHEIQGLENLPPAPFVIVSKHQSAWETITMHQMFPPFGWALKKSLKYIPIFGWALAATGQIFINRSKGTEAIRALQKEGVKALEQGLCMIIFPEGTRVAEGEVGDYKPGGVMMAMAAKVPIVPVAHDAGYYWPKAGFVKKPGTIRVRIGRPIETVNVLKSARKQLGIDTKEKIESMMDEIRQERGSSTPN
uniref:Putative 1-acyl-sn-glycerol-3-phosphate acyltransferase n=1 Tax=Magnetococcus massalia (strain MO-1) TaxID=451514 RepID=A0A1S7LKA2_MAGMO|nr:putative 1-acyl-sn-glycerol-3-phosphate acyltransferase [Candidatus Magnetococcus massalia]